MTGGIFFVLFPKLDGCFFFLSKRRSHGQMGVKSWAWAPKEEFSSKFLVLDMANHRRFMGLLRPC